MNTSRVIIKNIFGITEFKCSDKSIEAKGTNGAGKSSILDAIRYALTNSSDRDYIIKNGSTEGEILIETDSGLSIHRKIRQGKADYKSIKENGVDVKRPEDFLRSIFTPLQLNPVEFCNMKKEEQNRIILDLIEFDWDINWIIEQFGEIPKGINFNQNILKVLNDIQDDKGVYFMTRQNLNRDARNKTAFVHDIAKDIPEKFDFEKWNSYSLSEKYQELDKIKDENSKIQRAKLFKDSYNDKMKVLESERDSSVAAIEKEIETEKTELTLGMERMVSDTMVEKQKIEAQIKALQEKIITNEEKLNLCLMDTKSMVNSLSGKLEDKKKVILAEHETSVQKLNKDTGIADKYSSMEIKDITALQSEIETAEEMKKHLNEYTRMVAMEKEIQKLNEESEELTRKIELARALPGEILKTAKIPIEGLAVENGIPLINGLPISNLSTGEKMKLCVNVTLGKPGNLQIILLDDMNSLSSDNRDIIYNECKKNNIQFLATRTTDDNELMVIEL